MVACEQQFSAFLSLGLGTAGGSLRKLLPWIPGRHTLLLLLLTRWPFLLVSLAGLSKHCGAENSALSPLLSSASASQGAQPPGPLTLNLMASAASSPSLLSRPRVSQMSCGLPSLSLLPHHPPHLSHGSCRCVRSDFAQAIRVLLQQGGL